MAQFNEEVEEQLKYKVKTNQQPEYVFKSSGSAGNNQTELAQVLTAFDMFIALMGWETRPLAKFPQFLTQYQASLDAKYHNDFKDVLIAEEIERKRAERKGISILSQ